MSTQIDHLDKLALQAAKGSNDCFGYLSTGEAVYVALASNRYDMLDKMDYTIPQAMARLGEEWLQELMKRWQYRGDPRRFESKSV